MVSMSNLPRHYQSFVEDNPEFAAAYKALGDAAMTAGPLSRKDVELVKIGVSLGAKMESAVRSHCRKALEAGATPDEVRHAVMSSVTTIGFPTMMAGLKWVEDLLEPA